MKELDARNIIIKKLNPVYSRIFFVLKAPWSEVRNELLL